MKSNFLNLNEVVLIITIVELFFLIVLFRVLPSKQVQSRRILALFFLLVAGTLSTTLIIWNSYLQTLPIASWIVAPLILSCCLLLQGPVLYLYLRSLTESVVLLSWKNVVHLLPAFVAAAAIIIFQINITDWLPWNWASLSLTERLAVKFVWAVVRCVPLVYVFACFYTEYRLRQQQKQHYSMIPASELRWSEIVLGGFFIHWLWSFIGYFLGGYLSSDMNDLFGILNNYLTVILVNILFLFGFLNTRQLLSVTDVAVDAARSVEIPNMDTKVAVIERAIREQKLYLESHINLDRFSEKIDLKARDVSFIINTYYKTNFFEFINRYRVEEAKRLLLSIEAQQDTILDIVYKSGFNSQSAFHRFFKRIAGMTPSEFRSQNVLSVDAVKLETEK